MAKIEAKDIRIVLVEPSHPGNIGGAARAMKTMGLARLALVNPRRFPDPQADWRAAGALDVVRDAQVFGCLDDAVADCAWVVGASARSRRVPWPVAALERFAARLATEDLAGKPVAILFGREDSGLRNEELERCHLQLTIPTAPAYSSLNLAMAVQVVCYEIRRALTLAVAAEPPPAKETAASPSITDLPADWDRSPASAAETTALYRHLERVLVAIEFEDPTNPSMTMTRLRRLFARIRADETEVAILRGILTRVERTLGRDS